MITRRIQNRLSPRGSRGRKTGTGIPGRNMEPFSNPDGPTLGDGWVYEGGRAFSFTAGLEENAAITFDGAVPGKVYRVVTVCTEMAGSLPRIDVAIGSQAYYTITEPGNFDATFKAPVGGTTLTFTVNIASNTDSAILKQILVVEVIK